MDHDEQLPRISLESMRVWLRIKSDFAREVEAQANGYAKQHNLPPQRRIQFLESAKNVRPQFFDISSGLYFYSMWRRHSQSHRPTFASTAATLIHSNLMSKVYTRWL